MISSNLNIGGEELLTMALSDELMRRGHRVTWWGPDGPLLKEILAHNISYVRAPRIARGLNVISYVLKTTRSLRRLIEEREIDIVHSHTVLPVLSARLAVRKINPRPRIVFHEHGIHGYTYRIIGKCFDRLTDFIIANSHDERAKLIQSGTQPERCAAIQNCMYVNVDCSEEDRETVRREWGVGPGDPLIGAVGRLAIQKGHSSMLEAVPLLKDKFPTACFVIVGGGPLEGELREKCASLGIEDRVILAGFRRDLNRIYAALDIVAVPSVSETFGNVALEAMAAGRPVVASAVGGLVESVVDGQTGLLVPPSEPQALADAIGSLIENSRFAHRLGEGGRERVAKHFTVDRMADEVEELYDIITSQNMMPVLSSASEMIQQERTNEAAVDLGTI